MAKSKNASQHHNSQKAHRNGCVLPRPPAVGKMDMCVNGPGAMDMETETQSIKKPKTHRYPSLKGVDPKFRRNHRHALHGTMKALKERKEGKREVA
ncbi:hypothetical protein NUU61_001199 [Penicillium alfredii]|uniref:60S ribosomal protein L29 n=1 Tax=Penicillium alfredii TaxID=1506179 RepID=A0A9W9KRE4_9EURO|nr:uncharacterized protein NUU61_001199 [Penicillium alfredii]KAJ5115440.1 hypothetical protein NUU61_001199 [Penicillium alfredii]